MVSISKIFLIIGIAFIALSFLWPVIKKSGFGKLPGDITIENNNFKLYIPITSSIIASIIITLVFYIVRYLK